MRTKTALVIMRESQCTIFKLNIGDYGIYLALRIVSIHLSEMNFIKECQHVVKFGSIQLKIK